MLSGDPPSDTTRSCLIGRFAVHLYGLTTSPATLAKVFSHA